MPGEIEGEGSIYSWRTDYQLIGAGIAGALLILAALDLDYSHGFYTFLRIVVTITASACAWKAHQSGKVVTVVVACLVTILFNPLVPIDLDRSTWTPIDFLVALWFGWVATENLANAKGRPFLRFVPALSAIGLIVAVGLVSMAKYSQSTSHYEPLEENLSNSNEDPLYNSEAATPTRTMDQRVADAFEAATGVRDTLTEIVDGQTVVTKPLQIVELPFGTALLTRREIKDGCHACTGAIGVFYLNETDGRTAITGRWPTAVEGWGWGAPPSDWHMTDKFTQAPAIFASGSYMGQGIVMESATITELTAAGPKTSDVIGTGFSNEGAIVDESRPACTVKGVISNIRKDQSFDVVASGAVSSTDHYVKKSGRFVSAKSIDWGVPCDPDESSEKELN